MIKFLEYLWLNKKTCTDNLLKIVLRMDIIEL